MNIRRQNNIDWVVVVMLLPAFAVRVLNLELLPIFYDEAVYLRLAEQTASKLDLTIALNAVSTLQVWFLAPIYQFSPSPLWIGRFLSVLFGVMTVPICYKIAQRLYKERWVARMAAIFYAVVPYAVFHDRLAQNDGVLTFFLAVMVYLAVALVERSPKLTREVKQPPDDRWLIGIGLVLTFGLAMLAKRSGILFFATPILAGLLLQKRPAWRTSWPWLIAVMIGLVLITVPIVKIASSTSNQLVAQMASLELNRWSSQFQENIIELGEWFYRYFMWPAFILIILALGHTFLRLKQDQRRRADLFLAVVALIPIFFFTLLSRRWYPRYLLPAVFPLMILLSSIIWLLCWRWRQRQPWLIFVLAGAAVIPMFWFDILLINDPLATPLPREDRRQYIEGMPAGYGLSQVATEITDIANRGSEIVVWRNNRSVPLRYGLPHYLPSGRKNIDIETFFSDKNSWAQLEAKFDTTAQNRLTYLVLNMPYEKGVPALEGIARLRPTAIFPKPGGQGSIGLYRWLTPVEHILMTANLLPEAKIGLVGGFNRVPLPSAEERLALVRVEEAETAAALISGQDLNFHYLVADRAGLQQYRLQDEIGNLRQLPPHWSLEINYNQCQVCLFRIWPQPDDPNMTIHFGDGVRLLDKQLPDPPWDSTQSLPVSLYWQTDLTSLDQDVAVFLQVLDQTGRLVAQQDKTWLDGQFPAQIHGPDDRLSQAFTLDLTTVQGDVCLYIGLYRRSTGKRFETYQAGQPVSDNAWQLICGQVQ